MDKKGQGISMTFIVVAALALIVLIVIVLFFTGGMEKLIGSQTTTVTGSIPDSQKSIWVTRCKTACTLENKVDYCETAFKFDSTGDGNDDKYAVCDTSADKNKVDSTKVDGLDGPENLNVNCAAIKTCA